MFHVLAVFLQNGGFDGIPQAGVSTGVAGLVIYFWRQDRKDRETERDAQEKRYQMLAEDFRMIVQENTTAITSLRESIQQQIKQEARHG
jgi:hypothetical protein